MLVLSLSSLRRRTFADFHSSPLDLLFWDLQFLFSHRFSNFFTPQSVALLVFLLNFIQMLVAFNKSRVLTRKKTDLLFWNIRPTQQNYDQLQSDASRYKFAPALALKWYPKDLIGQAKLLEISAANQNRAANEFSVRASPVWPAKWREEGSCLWPRVLIIIGVNRVALDFIHRHKRFKLEFTEKHYC